MDGHFLGLPFKAIEPAHQAVFQAFFKAHPPQLAKYTFANLLGWQPIYGYAWCLLDEKVLLILRQHSGKSYLLQPVGDMGGHQAALLLEAMRCEARLAGMVAVSEAFLLHQPEFCTHFTAVLDRAMANYLYLTADLAKLAGGRYEKKRNLIAQAAELYTWQSRPLSEEYYQHCASILSDMGQLLGDESDLQALNYTLAHFKELNLKGLIIHVEGRPAAFSIYEQLNAECAVVHFEKAVRQHKGLYQIINQETAKAIKIEGFKYINREEDLGLTGLRQAKTSYFPAAILSSYTLTALH